MRLTEREFKLLKGAGRTIEPSTCEISSAHDGSGSLAIVEIVFGGPAAHFPSTSNTKTYYRKNGGYGICNTAEAQERLNLISDLFGVSLMLAKMSLPMFLDEPVQILIALADRRSDSHNYSKPICDWLQHIGIINNDSQAEAHCIRKRDYPMQYSDYERTTVLVMRRDFSHSFYERILGSLLWQARQLLG